MTRMDQAALIFKEAIVAIGAFTIACALTLAYFLWVGFVGASKAVLWLRRRVHG